MVFPISSVALEQIKITEDHVQYEVRLQDVFQKHLEEITSDANTDQKSSKAFEISSTKTLKDFSENQFTLIESEPIGYMIYHNDSGNFTEYSPTAPSPYLDMDKNLYYFGPTEYYVKNGTVLVHTITDDMLNISDNKRELDLDSDMMSKHLIENSDSELLEYLDSGTDSFIEKGASARASEVYIPGQQQINNMDSGSEMSYCVPSNLNGVRTEGICGYIASAITLAWYDNMKNQAIIDNSTYYSKRNGYNVFNGSPSNYANGKTFSYNLWRWHSPNKATDNGGTYGWMVADTINSYLKSRNIGYRAYYNNTVSTADITSYIRNYNAPYILLGNLRKNNTGNYVNHAVTIYGYNHKLIAHMGWEGYDNVYIDGTSWYSGVYIL